MVVWITGLSGSGKTTVAKYIIKKSIDTHPNMVMLDGDVVREIFNNDLGHEQKDRIVQIKRLQNLSLFLEKQNQIVIVSALYSSPQLLKWNRRNFKNYFEIFLNAPLEVVKKRDPKMIYKNYNLGKEKNIVGIDIAWHKPKNPDIEIKIKQSTSLEEIMDLILKKLTFYE